ncbi:hypothetical protein KKH23_10215 [Patescibacteria group bacterium]|nr:hypothetical protein [Patescibacteria group bacterium]
MSDDKVKLEPWELARQEGKTLICKIIGPMVSVYYPYRKGGDLYVIGPDGPNQIAHCCQDGCDCDFPIDQFLKHVNSHNKRLKKFPDIIIDKALVAPGIELPGLQSNLL